MEKIIIDADGAIFGRLCSFAAKKALEGNEIVVINSEKAIISGDRNNIIKKYQNLRRKGGHSLKGPKYSKVSYKMMKRCIRGMLPNHREGIGKSALSKVRCYNGTPEEFSKEKVVRIEIKKPIKYIELGEVSKGL